MDNLRITGLASGIDTEGMIDSLMQAERVKVDRVEQDRQVSLWRQEAYNDLNKDFANFILNSKKMFGLNSTLPTGSLVSNSYENLSWVKGATSSNPSVATVSTTGKAMDGTYDVEVEQLAKGVSMVSGDKISGTGKIADMIDVTDVDEIEFEINGKRILIGEYELDDENGNIKYSEGKFIDSEGYLIDTNGDHIQDDDGNDIRYDSILNRSLSEVTLDNVVRTINSTEDIGVRASYDAGIDRFFLQTTGTGEDAQIKIDAKDNGANFIEALKLTGVQKEDDGSISYADNGQDAKINFNGADNITSPTNNITINGITMNLADEGSFTVNVTTDIDAIYEKVETFVNDYNELVEKTNKLLGEKQNRDYKPLTDQQKKEMETSDIELWEEKAKSGLLRNDDIIQRTMQSVRTSIYEEFDGPLKLITDIGISTEKYSRGSAGGKLEIDEQKLKEAISQDPEAVMDMLFKGSNEEEDEKGGLVTRIHDNLISGMEDIIEKSGTGGEDNLYRNVKSNILLDFVTEYGSTSMIDENILDYSKEIDDLNDMLVRKENSYYAKFAAMEKAISRMNQQSSWLMQQFSG